MKKVYVYFLALLTCFISTDVYAHDIEVQNGGKTIYYDFINNNTELRVTFRGNTSETYANEYSGDVVIPESVNYQGNNYSVTAIGDNSFRECSDLTSVIIPNSVTAMGDCSFLGCSGLTSITISNSVTTIGLYAFYGCSDLTSITIPNSVTAIYDFAFENCSGLTSITIPSNVTAIAVSAFFGCSQLTSLSVESDNTQFDSRDNCNAIINSVTNKLIKGIKNTIIPSSVTAIGDYAFAGTDITSIIIPNSVTTIGYGAFSGCTDLTSITLPNSVTTIEKYAFFQCI